VVGLQPGCSPLLTVIFHALFAPDLPAILIDLRFPDSVILSESRLYSIYATRNQEPSMLEAGGGSETVCGLDHGFETSLELRDADLALKQTLKVVISGVLVGAVLLASYETLYWFTHVYENDARIRTELTNLSAQVNGQIKKVLVEEGSRVSAGQEVVLLEDDEIRLGLEALKTDLSLKISERGRLLSEKQAFETELESKLRTQTEKIKAIESEYASIKDRMALSDKNLARVEFLLQKGLTSEEKFNAEKDKVLVLRGEAAITSANIAVAKREYDQLKSTARQIEVFLEKIKISNVQQTRIQDDIRLQEVALKKRRIYSPMDGVVGRIHRYEGEYVEDGVTIVMLHNPARFWIEAYVDESQMRHVRLGQEVVIEFEIYPFEEFLGKVARIGNITTAEMGLKTLSSGSRFGGGVERVPVRIAVAEPPSNLTPGMRAKVNIRIYENIRLW
jgi:membrane fusion protein (multidrug efflux system)